MSTPGKMAFKVLFLAAFCCLMMTPTTGLQCYSCQVAAGAIDFRCLDDLANFDGWPYVDCPAARYCVIKRDEYSANNQLYTFWRGCMDQPNAINKTIYSSSYNTHWTVCSSNRCNDGNGTPGSWTKPGGGGGGGTMVAPGTGIGAPAATLSSAVIAGCLLAALGYTLRGM